MAFDIKSWRRLTCNGMGIYVLPDKPDWFVPNEAGDRLLRRLSAGGSDGLDLQQQGFLARLPASVPGGRYTGRATRLTTDRLAELWFHVTNRCNMTCSHCLFSSGPDDAAELGAGRVLALAGEAHALGCRVFALTGGEPFVHREIGPIVDGLLSLDETNVAILTNGTLLARHADLLRGPRADRLHLQISLDGMQAAHDSVRGTGTFDALVGHLEWLRGEGLAFTLSMCVQEHNLADMPALVELAAKTGAANVHFMWYFVRGRGERSGWAEPGAIFPHLVQAAQRADRLGVGIDNIDALKSRVFAPSGTIHDGSSAGWESLAVGPDGRLYPSAATVGIEELATEIDTDLAGAWRGSEVLAGLREATAANLDDPLRLILGGGDGDHSYISGGRHVGQDPYAPLHEAAALWLIAQEAALYPADGPPRLRLKMGDVLAGCGPRGPVALVHSNCLLAMAGKDGRRSVGEFYTKAARNPREDIRNPVTYPAELIAHIPEASRLRSYGCGSPVLDADLQPGDRVVDLGCGTGVECFITARLVGASGRVTGVDMLDTMLDFARGGIDEVAGRLGYRNVEFRKGYLEKLPLDDRSADVVLSNCVLNLSTNKRRTFAEIYRVLADGGRMVISDVVCEGQPPPAILNDPVLRGQCIAGALTQRDLMGLLEESGFVSIRVIRRFPYRVVRGHPFHSMTYEAFRASPAETVRVMYRGPAAAAVTASGTILPVGRTCTVPASDLIGMNGEFFLFDAAGRAVNVEDQSSPCGCANMVETGAPASGRTTEAAGEAGPGAHGPPELRAASCCSPPAQASARRKGR